MNSHISENEASLLKKFALYSLLLCLYTYGIMVIGPLVRAENAGLACPDWPLCQGHVIPPLEYRVYLEFIHRVVAGIGGLLFLGWAAAVLYYPALRKRFVVSAGAAVLLLTTQILLGMFTITKLLDPYIVKSHLLTAVLYLSVLVSVWIRSSRMSDENEPDARGASSRAGVSSVLGFTILVFIQLFLGGRVSTTYSGLACSEFPSCYSETVYSPDGTKEFVHVYFPALEGPIERHMTHRYMAYSLAVFAFLLIFLAEKNSWPPRQTKRIRFILILVLIQILLGGANVLFRIPVIVTVLHSAFAIALYITAFTTWFELRSLQSRTTE